MNNQEAHDQRVFTAVMHLCTAERELQGLLGGQADSVTLPGGKTLLLQPAQEKLRHDAMLQARAAGLQRAILDALPAHIALLDSEGIIIAVNEAWCRFAKAGELQEQNFGVGTNYLQVCEKAAGFSDEGAKETAAGIRKVLEGQTDGFSLEYPCHSPAQKRWFRLTVTPLSAEVGSGAVVMHVDITERKLAEEALKTSEERFQLAVRGSSAALWDWNITTGEVYYSPRWLELVGLDSESQPRTQDAYWQRVHPDDFAYVAKAQEAHLKERVPYRIEYRLRTGRGGHRWFVERGKAVWDEFGKPCRMVASLLDIHARKIAEEKAHELANRLSTTLESITDGFTTVDREWRFTYLNKRAEDILKCTRESILGRTLWEAFPDADSSIFGREYRRAVAENCSVQVEAFFPPLNTWLEANAYPSTQGLAIYLRDISRRKRAEEQVREQAALLDKAQDAILVQDLDGRTLYWNKSAERLYGWSADEVLGYEMDQFLYSDRDRSMVVLRAREDLMKAGDWTGELTKKAKDGREVIVQASWTLVKDTEGNPASILSIDTDITDRKKLEFQLLRSQRMESIGTLAGGIAHDLNNILSPILISLELLSEKLADPKDRDLVEILGTSAQRGADMVRQILTFSRGVEGHKLPIEPKHLIDELEKIVRDTFLHRVQIAVRYSDDCPPILGDSTQLHQVLLNLCLNARDAMPTGGTLTIGVDKVFFEEHDAARYPEANTGTYVVFRVTDTGTGIPMEIRDRIFDPFFTTKAVGKGTGLGLATSLAIVKSHGGFINLTSEVGKGTTFEVFLPEEPRVADENLEDQSTAPDPLPCGAGQLILLIDDEDSVRRVTSLTLENFGYQVVAATNGKEALDIYMQRQGEISVVFTDLMMPVMDGIDTTRALVQINPDVKIIAGTGLPTDTQVCSLLEAGARELLTKPYTAEAVLCAVQRTLAE